MRGEQTACFNQLPRRISYVSSTNARSYDLTAPKGHVFEIVNGEKTFILERVNQQQGWKAQYACAIDSYV
ncbi:hypothetical protein E4U17_004848, partial [Claviceps sp. LM77 group G4]